MHIPVKKFAMFPLNHIIVLKKADNLGVSILLWCIMVLYWCKYFDLE